MKHFAGFALAVGMLLSGATAASAADWRYRDYRAERRVRAERIRNERLRHELRHRDRW
jgi:hypothetical protein